MRRPHVVPLSIQAKSPEEIHQLTGRGRYVFPGRNDAGKTMSEASINQVIKRIGYDGKATGHGFRHTMSTTLHEQGYNTAGLKRSWLTPIRTVFVAPTTTPSIWMGAGKCFSGTQTTLMRWRKVRT